MILNFVRFVGKLSLKNQRLVGEVIQNEYVVHIHVTTKIDPR
jgi:hypothetical protein